MVKIICKICNKEHKVPNSRKDTAKYCSIKCQRESLKGEKNVQCTNCSKFFHMKKHQMTRSPRTRGYYCSNNCKNEDMKIKMLGINNHQYGLKGKLNSSFKSIELSRKNHNNIDIRVYKPEHPFCDKNGRVLKHRLIVEENYEKFDIDYFININNLFFLKKQLDVHHINYDHNDNRIENLQILTRSNHTKLHSRDRKIIRDKLGRITGVVKQGELLENLEADNQQPSLSRNTFEGSTTNTQIQTDKAVDSNSDTSALPLNK